jgi:hypothetical protein
VYGLKNNEDLQPLLGATLTQVCVGQNEVVLNFDRPVSVTVLSDFSVSLNGAPKVRYQDARHGAVSLLPLIGNQIGSAVATTGGGLQLEFESGALEIFDESSQYESFWLKLGDKEIIV